MPRQRENRSRGQFFIPLPDERDTASDIKINGESVIFDYLTSSFTKELAPGVGFFRIDLINAGGEFSNRYSKGQTVKLFVDKTDGTTKRFTGTIDSIIPKRGNFETLEISGGHVGAQALDVTITAEYKGTKTCDTILKEIVASKLPTFTTNNVNASTVLPTLKWSNVPIWTAIDQLCQLAVPENDRTISLRRFDAYADDDKDIHFFEENSIENNQEVIWKDTIMNLKGFGKKDTLTKNKAIVYGDDGTGLPIIRISENTSAQTDVWLKESVIINTDINTGNMASETAQSIIDLESINREDGGSLCFILPTLSPGDKVHIIEPTQLINTQTKIYKFTHRYPNEMTEVVFDKEETTSTIARKNMLRDLANAVIINPFEMITSINFTFDNLDGIASKDDNVGIEDGVIKLTSGAQGTFTSDVFNQKFNVTSVQLKVVGEKIAGNVVFRVASDGGTVFEIVTTENQSTITSGKSIVIKAEINSADTEIDSLALLMR